MAHTPLKMTIPEAHAEVLDGWNRSYSPEAIAQAVESFDHKPLGYRINIFVARLCFRGIYFPMMGRLAWVTQTPTAVNSYLVIGLMGGVEAWDADKHYVRKLALKLRSLDLPNVNVETVENRQWALALQLIQKLT
jgi:hypothetical protein